MNKIKKNKTSKGFTLIEIVIATAMFAMIMVITASTFSWAVAYNGKLKQMRLTSINGMKVAEDVSSEIRLANGSPLNTSINGNWYQNSQNGDFRLGEIVLMRCDNILMANLANCSLHSSPDIEKLSGSMKIPVYLADANSNALLIFQRSKKRMVF